MGFWRTKSPRQLALPALSNSPETLVAKSLSDFLISRLPTHLLRRITVDAAVRRLRTESPEFLYRLDSILILASNSPICIFLSAGLPAPPSGDSPVKGYDINQLLHEAQFRWLKPVEVFFILQNHEMYKIIQEPA
ncbi:hypothetical protein LINPERHAP2_LOCUS9934 [Linum perenne]